MTDQQPQTLAEAVGANVVRETNERQATRDAHDASTFRPNTDYERAIAIRDSGDEGRQTVADAYRGVEMELALYERQRATAIKLGKFDPKETPR